MSARYLSSAVRSLIKNSCAKIENMFSTGQYVFAVLFAVAFLIIIILSYKKDKKLHLKNYKGVKWVGIVFLAFILFLFVVKFYLNK